MSRGPQTLQALYRANIGILKQKLDLIQVLRDEFGESAAKEQYQQPCPIVRASVGQHVRHSMDHMELAANMAVQKVSAAGNAEIHYDLRSRGGSDESDMDEAEARIRRVQQLLREQATSKGDHDNADHASVLACFMLSGDGDEFQLPSTIHRELGFAAHHAIHHLAMVKIIALETLQLSPDIMPLDFGKAPSTINYDNSGE